MTTVDFCDDCWTTICAFLSPRDELALLGLCKSVVHAPIRRDFFSRTTWRIPTDASAAERVIGAATMRTAIKRAEVRELWQQRWLVRFPALESVRVVLDEERQDDFATSDVVQIPRLQELKLIGGEIFYLEPLLPVAAQLKVFDICDAKVCDGLKELLPRLVNLHRLNSNTSCFTLTDLTPLSSLLKLEELYICVRPHADWTSIAGLTNLRVLSQLNGFAAVTPATVRAIESLPNLRVLRSNRFSAELLEHVTLPQLESLRVSECVNRGQTARLRFLSGKFPRLRELEIMYGTLDMESIAQNLPKLKTLRVVAELRLEDIAALAQLTQLEHLSLEMRGVGATHYANELTSALQSSLRSLRQLRSIALGLVPLRDLSLLADLNQLRVVDLSKMQNLKDLSDLRGHPSVSRLILPRYCDCSSLYGPDGLMLPNATEIYHSGKGKCLGPDYHRRRP